MKKIILLTALMACGKKTEVTTSADATPAPRVKSAWEQVAEARLDMSVRARDIGRAYDKNKVGADAKYKDKVVEVLGSTDKPGETGTGTFIDVHAWGSTSSWQHSQDVEGVRCYINMGDGAQKAAVGALHLSSVRVRGRVTGALEAHHVLLDGCSLDVGATGDAARVPTIPFPRRGKPEDCARFDACCPADVSVPAVKALCAMADDQTRDEEQWETCADAIRIALVAYETAHVKPPATCTGQTASTPTPTITRAVASSPPTASVRPIVPRCHKSDGTAVMSCDPGDSLCTCD